MVSQQAIQQLRDEGYSDDEIKSVLQEVEQEELMNSYQQAQGFQDPRIYAQQSAFGMVNPQDNLIKWQLEVDNILERAEHILRGDKLEFKGGHLIWIKAQEGSLHRIMNEYGVQEVMKVLSMYINRNTILADYEPDEIDYKVYDFGREVNDLFFMKYEEFGLDTLEKRKNYPILIREIVDIVHSSYKRALRGGERRSLREARQVTQSEAVSPYGININTGGQQPKERGIFNPLRYIVGKYK